MNTPNIASIIATAKASERAAITAIITTERDTYQHGNGVNYRRNLNTLLTKISNRHPIAPGADDPYTAGLKLGKHLAAQQILENVLNDSLIQTTVNVDILERLTQIIEAAT